MPNDKAATATQVIGIHNFGYQAEALLAPGSSDASDMLTQLLHSGKLQSALLTAMIEAKYLPSTEQIGRMFEVTLRQVHGSAI